jgi:hypothetical protein
MLLRLDVRVADELYPSRQLALDPPNAISTAHRDLIIELAARHRLPAVYVPL